MTIEYGDCRIDLAADLFELNECLNLRRAVGSDASLSLACITVSRTEKGFPKQHGDLIWSCIRQAWDSWLCDLPLLSCWLFACVCGEDTRVFRYRGLWYWLAAQGLEPAARATRESLLVHDDGTLCMYGLTAADRDGMEQFRPVTGPHSQSFLVLLPHEQVPDLDLVIAAGWKRGLANSDELRDIALVISRQGGITLRMFGAFDDREAGVDCVMSPDTYEHASALLRKRLGAHHEPSA